MDYGFASNHPSYVFIDAIVIGFWWFFRWLMAEGNDERLYEANIWVAIASLVPAWRLVCWYGLRRRPGASDELQPAVSDAWKPVANLYLWFIGPLAVLIAALVVSDAMKTPKILAEMPTIEASAFNEGVFEKLRDPVSSYGKATRLIRLRAIQRSAKARRCFDKERRPSVTVLADLGAPGDLVILNDRTGGSSTRAA